MKLAATLVCLTGLFVSNAKALELSIGHGIQYSGLIGIQSALIRENHSFRGSIGLIGLGVGYDYFINDNVSLGGSLTYTVRSIHSLNATYYFSGHTQKGFRLGIDIGQMKGDNIKWPTMGCCQSASTKSDPKTIAWFSVGYKF